MAAEQHMLSKQVFSLLERGHARDVIVAELMGEGHDERFVKELVYELARLRQAKRRSQLCAHAFHLLQRSFLSIRIVWPYQLRHIAGICRVHASFLVVFWSYHINKAAQCVERLYSFWYFRLHSYTNV